MLDKMNHMIKSLTLFLVFGFLVTPLSALQSQAPKEAANWDAFRFLIGEWVGEGTGAPGEATGGFSFSFDLDGQILVRRNRSDYPATKEKPAYSHTDLMVIYKGSEGARAIYFDNEGHVIHYAVSLSKDQATLTFLSDPAP